MEHGIRRTIMIAGLGIAAVLSAGIAFGAIPAGDGTIHACRDHAGRLRVIDAESRNGRCSKHEKPLVWSQAGPAGPAGPSGADGAFGWQVVNTATPSDDEPIKTAVAECPSGQHVLGGGVVTGVRAGIHVTNSFPHTTPAPASHTPGGRPWRKSRPPMAELGPCGIRDLRDQRLRGRFRDWLTPPVAVHELAWQERP
jgi:hypothetical protein